jgi:HEAT repeat protein
MLLVVFSTCTTIAQAQDSIEQEELKMAALEALMMAPSDRALPIVQKVLAGNNSDEVKMRALFILTQIGNDEAQEILLQLARDSDGELQMEAVRMIGIGGDSTAMAGLSDLYATGSPEIRESILHAYMIAGDTDAVFELAVNAPTDEEFEIAVHFLGVMGAVDKLQQLPVRPGASESLIHAMSIAGDVDGLTQLALSATDSETQMNAIHGLGIAGGDEVGPTLLQIYGNTNDMEVKEAVMNGLMIAGDDDAVFQLYQNSSSTEEKTNLLRILVMMDSDAAMEAIDAALSGDR